MRRTRILVILILSSFVANLCQAADVLFDIKTDTGNDTLWVGVPGSIIFTVDASDYELSGLIFPFELNFSSINVLGPLSYRGNVGVSLKANAIFEEITWHGEYGNGNHPDTLLIEFMDTGGTLWCGSDTVFKLNVTASGPGTVRFEGITVPPGSVLGAVVPDTTDIPIRYLFAGKLITFEELPPEQPLVSFSFGCAYNVLTNSHVCVPLSIENLNDDCIEIGSFDLLFTYDPSILTFTGLDLTGALLDQSDWVSVTHQIVSTDPPRIRIVANAGNNSSNAQPGKPCLDGLLANVCFDVTADQNAGCQPAYIQFCWDDCGDNTASSPGGDTEYIIADPHGPTAWAGGNQINKIPGGGVIANSCGPMSQLATFTGDVTGPADYPCNDPEKSEPQPTQSLLFVNGVIVIICPGDNHLGETDLNLNGLAFEIADAELYAKYFILGVSAFTINVAGQTASSDTNVDGVPLTVADMVYLIRVITGDAVPTSGRGWGHAPEIVPPDHTIEIMAVQHASNITVSARPEIEVGAMLLVFKYEDTDILDVSVKGRASSMDISHRALDGELRVLLYNIRDRARIEACPGEILNISSTTGIGSIQLVSVEAASFMGESLESIILTTVLKP